MNVQVQHEGTLLQLSRQQAAFARLKDFQIAKTEDRYWSRPDKASGSHDIQAIFIGKTGYGKSTTVNALSGLGSMKTSDVEACTRSAQSLEFKIREGHYFSLADLPGLGESQIRDEEYLALYASIVKKADVAVYVIRADTRDYAIDEAAFNRLFPDAKARRKAVLALNCCDKIEPLNRHPVFYPSEEQMHNIERKIQSVKKQFDTPNTVVAYSAACEWNLDRLAAEMVRVISLSQGISC